MAYIDLDKIQQGINSDYRQMVSEMNQQIYDLSKEAEKMLEQVREMKLNFTWGAWEPYKVKYVPKRIKGKWYWPGATVYRKQRIGVNPPQYMYGDDFDLLKDAN